MRLENDNPRPQRPTPPPQRPTPPPPRPNPGERGGGSGGQDKGLPRPPRR